MKNMIFLWAILAFLCGCTGSLVEFLGESQPNQFVSLKEKSDFFHPSDNVNTYKIAFQSDFFKNGIRPTGKRIDIFISNLDGTDNYNLTENLHKNSKDIYFLFPCWSADGKNLNFIAFCNIKSKKENDNGHQVLKVSYLLEGYMFDSPSGEIKKINSVLKDYRVAYEEMYRLQILEPLWSNDGKRLLREPDLVLASLRNYPVVPIMFEEFKNDLKLDSKSYKKLRSRARFVPAQRISPNGEYEIINYDIEVKKYGPEYPVIGIVESNASAPLVSKTSPLIKLNTPSGAIDICYGRFDMMQWTTDSKFCVAYNRTENRFYIINLKGEVFFVTGSHPSILGDTEPLYFVD